MTKYLNSLHPIIQVPISQYETFCLQLRNEITTDNLDIFKDVYTCNLVAQLCTNLFPGEIRKIASLLNDINIGIAALDIPESPSLNSATNTVCGTAIVMGIFNKIGKSNIDPTNSTPFTLHTASHNNGKLLELTDHTPDAKLGFHNDGLISQGNLEIPNHIAVYNLYISYRQPGMFRWIPIALWDEASKYGEATKKDNIKIKTRLTPYFHLDKENSLIKTEFDLVETPISIVNKHGQRRFFLNGKVLCDDNDKENVELVHAIRYSLEKNNKQISIEQKERRAFYLKNTAGFHARDIFKDPIKGVDLTRVFLRTVDVNTETYPCNIIKN